MADEKTVVVESTPTPCTDDLRGAGGVEYSDEQKYQRHICGIAAAVQETQEADRMMELIELYQFTISVRMAIQVVEKATAHSKQLVKR